MPMIVQPTLAVGSCYYANLITATSEKVKNFNAPSTTSLALEYLGVDYR